MDFEKTEGLSDLPEKDSGELPQWIKDNLEAGGARESELPEQDFLRVHKSALVNIHRIEAMDRSDKSLLPSDGSRAYISKVHYKEVTEALEAFRGKA